LDNPKFASWNIFVPLKMSHTDSGHPNMRDSLLLIREQESS
jgi:hypothetical protein